MCVLAKGSARQLTPKQACFVREYLIDMDAGQAAIRAGYSPKSAPYLGYQLLQIPLIQKFISAAQDARASRTAITSDRVLQELALLGFSDLTHYRLDEAYNVTLAPDAPPQAMRALSSVKHRVRTIVTDDGEVERLHEVEYRLWDKNTALTNLGKHFKLFTDRLELVGPLMDEIRRLAAQSGMTVEEVLAEAEALASGRST
jgi:phage terminase small subunit